MKSKLSQNQVPLFRFDYNPKDIPSPMKPLPFPPVGRFTTTLLPMSVDVTRREAMLAIATALASTEAIAGAADPLILVDGWVVRQSELRKN